MKLFVLVSICLTLVITIHGAPTESNSESEFASEDDKMKEYIAENIRFLSKLSDDNEIATALLKSIDQECMLQKYRKNKLDTELTKEVLQNFRNAMLDLVESEDKPIDPVLVFANIALTCSNKLNALLGFVFDNLFSYSGLLDAFREDEPFKEFLDDLVCYNSYAVKKNLLDPNEYIHLHYKLVNQTEAECEEKVNETKESYFELIDFSADFIVVTEKKCLRKEIISEGEKMFLKYGLLIPLGLNDEQKKHQRSNFIGDIQEALEKLLACNLKTENPKDNEIPT